MTDAIKERLRHVASCGIPDFTNSKLLDEAAARIEELERIVHVDALIARQLSQSMSINTKLDFRIKALEAALTDIIIYSDDPAASRIARAALDKDASK